MNFVEDDYQRICGKVINHLDFRTTYSLNHAESPGLVKQVSVSESDLLSGVICVSVGSYLRRNSKFSTLDDPSGLLHLTSQFIIDG